MIKDKSTEPKGMGLLVGLTKRSKEDFELFSKPIAHYKATDKNLSFPRAKLKTS